MYIQAIKHSFQKTIFYILPTTIFTKQFLSVLLIYFLCNSLFLASSFAQNETANIDPSFSVEICEENTILSLNDDVSKLNQNCFEEITLAELNAEKYQDQVLLKVTVTDPNKKFIAFDKHIDSIKIYYNNKIYLFGNLVAKSQKQLPLTTATNAFEVLIYNQPFYIEIISSYKMPISTKMEVLNETEFTIHIEKRKEALLIQVLIQGMMWIILLYNLGLFIATKEKVYLAYATYIFGFAFFALQHAGILVDYFIPETPHFSLFFRIVSLGVTGTGFCLFILTFLPKRTISKFWQRLFYGLALFCSLMTIPYTIIAYGLENHYLYIRIAVLAIGSETLFMLVFLGSLARKYWSETLVKYFLVGSFVLVGSVFLVTLLQGIFGNALGNIYLFSQVGGVLEILIFSLGLGYRMKQLEKENARILENQNRLLEQKVLERTKEISMKKEEILVQNEELHQQQEEIISQRDYIEKQNTQLKTANTQFTDSVRYAKTIQKAILPMKQRVQTHFEDSFVLFRPRDIVSGDFYWVYETQDPITKEEIILIAVLDCTGHGVPGAFISLIGFAILNEIVSKELTTKPAQILQRLDGRLQEALRQKQSNNMDGMDVALCAVKKVDSIHHSTGKKQFEVTFSGAKRPLYYIKDDVFEELRGNKMSVGGITKKKERTDIEFQEEKIILTKGDKIYLTSDGFADQNGRNQQKIGSLKLKSFLEKLHTLPLSEQKTKLEEILDMHQGKQKQRDDITIMGVKL